MTFQQDSRVDFWTVLKRRKRSIRNFLEINDITNIQKFNNWIKIKSSEFIFTEAFQKEVLNHLEEVKPSVQSTKVRREVKSEEEVRAKESPQEVSSDVSSPEDVRVELEFTISQTSEETGESDEEELPSWKKSKKKKI